MNLFRSIALSLALLMGIAPAAAQWQTPNHSVPIGRGAGVTGFGNAAPGTAKLPLISNGAAFDPSFQPLDLNSAGTTGIVPTAKGGTGLDNSTNAANDVLVSNGVNGSFIHTAFTTLVNTVCTAVPATCATVLGYSNLTWFSPVCDGTTDDAVPLQVWLNSIRDGGVGVVTATQSISGCGSTAPLLLQASTNVGPVQGPSIQGSLRLIGLVGIGATATGTGSGTNLTLSGVVGGSVHVGDTVTGTGINANTHILSQTSGTTGGAGVYVTDFATTGVAAFVTVTSDLLRIWNPTAVITSQNFYYAILDSLVLSIPGGSSFGNCLSVRGWWGSVQKILGNTCHGGDLVQFPNWIGPGAVPDEYESNPWLGDVTCVSCDGYVVNNLIGIGATPRIGNIRGTTGPTINTGLGAIRATGSEHIYGAIAYTGQGWGATISQPPAGGGAIVTTPHEVFAEGAGDIDCAQNGVKIAALQFGTVSGHRMNTEAAGICGVAFPQWPITAYSIGGGGGSSAIIGVTIKPYITVRPGYVVANTTLFDFNNDAQIDNLIVDSIISDQTGLIAPATFAQKYKNINAAARIKIIENGTVMYDTFNLTTFANLQPCVFGLTGVTRTVSDSTTAVFRGVIAGGGGNQVRAACIANQWLVD